VFVGGLIMPPSGVMGLGVVWLLALGVAIHWRGRPEAVIAMLRDARVMVPRCLDR
jgi:hypothetical protein